MNEEILIQFQKKQLLHARIQTGIIGLIFLMILCAGVLCTLEFIKLKTSFNETRQEIETAIEGITSLDLSELNLPNLDMETINATLTDLSAAADNLSAMDIESLNETVTSLKSAADTLGNMDIDALNEAIASLQDAAETFKGIDVESLNALVTSLETVANKLENTVNSFSNFFSFNRN